MTFLLIGCGVAVCFLFYQFLVGFEVLGDPVEKVPDGVLDGVVVDRNGNLDVQDFGVGALYLPWHVNFHIYEVVFVDLQNAMRVSFKQGGGT